MLENDPGRKHQDLTRSITNLAELYFEWVSFIFHKGFAAFAVLRSSSTAGYTLKKQGQGGKYIMFV